MLLGTRDTTSKTRLFITSDSLSCFLRRLPNGTDQIEGLSYPSRWCCRWCAPVSISYCAGLHWEIPLEIRNKCVNIIPSYSETANVSSRIGTPSGMDPVLFTISNQGIRFKVEECVKDIRWRAAWWWLWRLVLYGNWECQIRARARTFCVATG